MESSTPAADVAVLIVDDDPRNLLVLEALLADLDLTVVTAQSGADCLRQVLQREFALVLLDVQMPEMDGIETATMIRGRAQTKHLPIIFLTAFSHSDEIVSRAYEVGAVDFLFKPLQPLALRSKVSVFVELYRARKDVEAAERHAHAQSVAELRATLAAESLRAQMEVERRASERKDEFLAMLGHELRNPLASLRYALELGAQPGSDAPSVHGVFDRQVRHLQRIVDDLLDVARITHGKIELQRAPVSLVSVLEQATEQSAPLLRAHVYELARPDEDVVVDGDAVRLTQVVTNLLSNAARHTPAGARVRLGARREGEHAIITVADEGRGIDPAVLPKIFELFVQAGSSRERKHGGLGLGLTLVREIVGMHGGSVTATSDGVGRGSAFTVRLPAVAAVKTDASAAAVSAHDTSPGLDVVVVEDNEDAREMLEAYLRRSCHRVEVAADGLAGLARLSELQPAIAFVDIGLPELDGHEVARRFRASFPAATTRLVAVTGFGQPHDRRAALDAGFDEHLVKPVALARLEQELDAAAQLRRPA